MKSQGEIMRDLNNCGREIPHCERVADAERWLRRLPHKGGACEEGPCWRHARVYDIADRLVSFQKRTRARDERTSVEG